MKKNKSWVTIVIKEKCREINCIQALIKRWKKCLNELNLLINKVYIYLN